MTATNVTAAGGPAQAVKKPAVDTPDRRSARLRVAGAAVFFLLVAAISLHGVALHPGTRVACCISDSTSAIRDYVIAGEQHQNLLTFTHDGYNGAPEGTPRPVASLVANAGLQTLVMSALQGPLGVVGALNFYIFLGLVGTATAMFWLLQRLGCSLAASLYGGFVVGFNPWVFEQVYSGAIGLIQNWAIVLAVSAMLGLRECRTYRRCAVVSAAIALAFYVSAYTGIFASVTVLAFMFVELWRLPDRADRIRSVAMTSFIYGVVILALAPIALLATRNSGVTRLMNTHAQGDLFEFAASVRGYLLHKPSNPLTQFDRSVHRQNAGNQTVFVGYGAMLLSLIAAVLLIRRNEWLQRSSGRWWGAISLAALAPLALVLSLPPLYHVRSVTIPMPSAFLSVSSYIRDYARLGIVFAFAVAGLAALGLSALARRPGRIWRLCPAVAAAVAVLEFLPGNIGAFNTSRAPSWVSWLATAPRGIVATYPMELQRPQSYRLGLRELWYQSLDKDPSFRMIQQNLLVTQTRQQAIRFAAFDLTDPVTARILSTEGVRYVVVDDVIYRSEHRAVPILNPRFYTLLARRAPMRIYSVHAPHVSVDHVLRDHEDEIAQLEGLGRPPVVAGSGFRTLGNGQSNEGLELLGNGHLEIVNRWNGTQGRLTGRLSNNGEPTTLEVRSEAGAVLAQTRVPAGVSDLNVGPFPIAPNSLSHVTVVERGSSSAHRPRLILSGLSIAPRPAYLAAGS